jgi:N-methylhydantoinase A
VSVKVGVDVGGTFTDLVLVNGGVSFGKVATTPRSPAEGVLDGLRAMGVEPAEVSYFVHGSTIALNAILERRGVTTALVTTHGFRDVLEIMRTNRPELYDLQQEKPAPLVPRRLRFAVHERVAADGEVLEDLAEEDVAALLGTLEAEGVEAVAVCLINSYVNDVHERRVRDLLQAARPGLSVTISSEMVREWREFERTSTAVVNAYVRPLVQRYSDALAGTFAASEQPPGVFMMQSNGGLGTEDDVRERPAATIMSGPVGGVTAAERLAELVGRRDLLTLDIGGTSADMCLIRDGRGRMVAQREVDRFPVLSATVDVHAIGAGGGSIAWLDRGGALQCGPRSAGALPGPACYGRGGTEPTVTDAHLVLGHLDPAGLLGGDMTLDVQAARAAIEPIGEALGMSVEAAAAGIVRVLELRMVEALRALATRAGQDLRDYALVPFGGAGPLHGAQLCRELDIGHMIVPIAPGTFSALGMLMADLRRDEATTAVVALVDGAHEEVEGAFTALEARALASGHDDMRIVRTADLRYEGQEFTVNTGVPARVDAAGLVDLKAAFELEHERLYGYRLTGDPIVLVTARISTIRPGGGATLDSLGGDRGTVASGPQGYADVYDSAAGEMRRWDRHVREALTAGTVVTGPAVIQEARSTTIIGTGDTAEVDPYGNLLVTIGGAR